MGSTSSTQLLAIIVGALVGGGIFTFIVALRGLPPKPPGRGPSSLELMLKDLLGIRGLIALAIGVVTVVATRWAVAGIGMALLALAWRSIGGASGERQAIARLEGLATWTESLRDTIAGAVGLEQAIPSSLRVAAPSIQGPLAMLVDRLHTRVPMPDALRRFANDLNDPGADLIVAALIINARLRGPGLRDLLGALAGSVREEVDMRRKVYASRRATRRSVQIVVVISVGLALVLALFDRSYVAPYNGVLGQGILSIVAALYAASFIWLRKLANYRPPERLLDGEPVASPSATPETVGAWQGSGG